MFSTRAGRPSRLRNCAAAIADWAAGLAELDVIVVFEATGAYDRPLRIGLSAAGVAYVRVNPMRARCFAQAAGFLAKTDAVDARMLSAFGQALGLAGDTACDPARAALAELTARRDQLVSACADEKKRRAFAPVAIRASIDAHITWLISEIKAMDAHITASIKASRAFHEASQRLQSIPGIGPVTAALLLGQMPELGRTGPKPIAALAGLAPFNTNSGQQRGKRSIRAGRARIRQALYMAALTASRSNPRFKACTHRIAQRAKAKKIAIIAIARKLLIIANAMMRDNTSFQC